MSTRRQRSFAWSMLAVTLLASAATAQQTAEQPPAKKEKPPSASLFVPVLRARSAAPMPIEVKIDYDGDKVYRGTLTISVRESGRELTRLITPEIVVTRGQYVQPYMLPPVMPTPELNDPPVAYVNMTTADGTLDLGVHPLGVAQRSERSMVLGIVDVWENRGGRNSTLIASAMLDRFKPNRRETGIGVSPARITPGDMPLDPMSLCAMDVVLIPPDGLAELDAKQLAALGQWLRGGGAVCIVLGGQLKAQHAAFLNAAVGDSAAHRFAVNSEGRAELTRGELREGLGFWRCGVGRLVIAMNPPDEAYFESPDWAAAIAKLWAIRRDQIVRVASGGGWDASKESKSPWRNTGGGYGGYPAYEELTPATGLLRYGPLPMSNGATLPSLLTPVSVQVVPFAVVVGILALFALAIGPGDWLLLGVLRQRKLTWLLFPATALAFTLLIVVIADRTMGSVDHDHALVVADVDATGTVLRRSRIELLYPGRHRTLVHELEHAWMTRMDRPSFEPPGSGGSSGATVDADDLIVRVSGRMPTRWRLTQRVRKWTPWMNRTTTIAPSDAETGVHLPWGKLVDAVRANAGKPEAISFAVTAVLADRPIPGAVALYDTRGEAQYLAGERDPNALGFASKVKDIKPLLDDLCARQREGLFTVVAQIAPTGSDNLEDLSLLDRSDASMALLVVVEPRGDNLIVWRHLFTLDGASR